MNGWINMIDDEKKAVWNIDDEILKIIKELKLSFIISMRNWKLEDAYWFIDLICMECDAKLMEQEREDIESELKKLEEQRQIFETNGRRTAGNFYVNLRNLYKKINWLMKEHGVWFREREEDIGL